MKRPLTHRLAITLAFILLTSFSTTGCRDFIVDASAEEQAAMARPDSLLQPCLSKNEYCYEPSN